jgi:hypothetical protein
MARRSLSGDVKQGILNGLRNNENKAALASKFGVSVVTVYNYAKTLNTETVGVNAGNPDVALASQVPSTVTNGTAPVAIRAARKVSKRSR